MSDRILVIGGTGTIGSELLRGLTAAGIETRALTRRAEGGTSLPGITWVRGDLRDPGLLPPAFEGVDRAFLLTSNEDGLVRSEKNAIRAAGKAGVARIVKLSALGASDHSRSVIGLWHWAVEQALKDSGMIWTILRPHHFMQNLFEQQESIRREGVIRSATGEGRIPFIDTRDIAEVAQAVLTEEEHAGRTYTLTGPEALSYREATETLAEVTGLTLRYSPETPLEAWPRMLGEGMPDWKASALLAIAAYQRAGGVTEGTTDTVERLLGRPPRTLRDFARDHAGAFRRPDGRGTAR